MGPEAYCLARYQCGQHPHTILHLSTYFCPPNFHRQAFAERAKAAKAGAEPLATSIPQFYQTDAISRASKVMAKCIKVRAAAVPCVGDASRGAAHCRAGVRVAWKAGHRAALL